MPPKKSNRLHIFFLPFMAPGHMIPATEMIRLFANQGIECTILTTPANLHYFSDTIKIETQKPGIKINLITLYFPSKEAGLPEGSEKFETLTSLEMMIKFFKAIDLLEHPVTEIMDKIKPNCLIADAFFSWASHVSRKFQIPCLAFQGTNYFSSCIVSSLLGYEPYKEISSDSELFTVPGDLPHEVKLMKSELPFYDKNEGPDIVLKSMNKIREEMKKCYGVIMNSFYELESAYIDYYEEVIGMKHWHVGPFSLYFDEEDGKDYEGICRGNESSVEVSECRRWLDEKGVDSVIYVCLGSVSNVCDAQLHEIALALEGLGQNFVLVVRKEDSKEWVPHGFEERVNGKGLIIWGWAPQMMILHHRSVGGFVTHCGWNSILEGVISGVPMVTWPIQAEQFYNEKLVTKVLKIGVQIGGKQSMSKVSDQSFVVGYEMILKAMKMVMVGEEGRDIRNRVNELKEMARMAVSKGGSSECQLNALIEELKLYKLK
ncbi:unnamed protein product [Amaranthus hypochondriacus]